MAKVLDLTPPCEGAVMQLTVEPHALFEPFAFVTELPGPLAEGPWGLELPALVGDGKGPTDVPAPDDEVKTKVRALLRAGGFKPAGRNKPASEYVRNAVPAGKLGAINAAVDACNAASYHSGLPISVVDIDLAREPFRTAVAPEGSRYVFNRSEQVIELAGLLCLCDAEGPCANAVKDCQRTKTNDATRRTLTVIWGTNELPGRAAALGAWYRGVLEAAGARTEAAELVRS